MNIVHSRFVFPAGNGSCSAIVGCLLRIRTAHGQEVLPFLVLSRVTLEPDVRVGDAAAQGHRVLAQAHQRAVGILDVAAVNVDGDIVAALAAGDDGVALVAAPAVAQ